MNLIDRLDLEYSIRQQCDLFSVPSSSYYYIPVDISPINVRLMASIDRIFTRYPFYGKRRILFELNKLPDVTEPVNIKRIARLMKIMGIEAVYPKPNTSKPTSGAQKYPYLLKGLDIIKPNQVWASDITYIPTSRGFVYLTAIIDWYSRFILSWELSTSMDTSFCLSALEKATANYGVPEIFNTDQGSQYTSVDFTSYLNSRNIKISHDSRGRCFDNIMIERIWRSVKYENVYLRDYNTVAEAREGLDEYLNFYNTMRPHQSLDYMTPQAVYNDK